MNELRRDDYPLSVCNLIIMIRAQIVLNEPVADRQRMVLSQTGASMLEIVRKDLVIYFEQREPDLGWIGSLKSAKWMNHDLADIRASVAAGHRRESRR